MTDNTALHILIIDPYTNGNQYFGKTKGRMGEHRSITEKNLMLKSFLHCCLKRLDDFIAAD